MTSANGSRGKIFSGKLHPGFWILGISLLTAGVHNTLTLTEAHSLLVPLGVGAALGTALFAYTHRHRKHVKGLHKKGAEVRKSEVKYRTFFENSTDAMLIIEGDEFIDCNEAAVTMLGYDRKEEVILTHPSKLSPAFQPDGRSSAEKAEEMMRLAKEQGHHRFEWDHLRKDGAVIPVEISLTAIPGDGGTQLHGVWRDLSDRKLAGEALRKSELLLRSLIETIPDLIWLKDPEGVYLFCNSKFERFFGAKASEIVGKTDYDFVDRELADFFRENDRIVMASGGPNINEEDIVYADDGHEEKLETLKTPVYAGDGTLLGVLGVGHDITAKREMESQYRQAQKMEAVGQMAGGIAHDFNNLLQIIGGYAELSEASTDPESSIGASLKQIDKAAQRGKTLIKQLLAFSRRQVIDPVDLNLNEVFEPLLKMIQGLIGEHIKLEMVPEQSLGTVRVDRGLVEQVLMNLCVNARDAMPEGGTLTIETENVSIDSEYAQTHSWATEGPWVLLSVIDTGCGMDEHTLERVFEPFFTTKEVGKGTGLGLSMAYGIIEQHNGHISATSEPDQGARVEIYLPAVEHRAAEVSNVVPGPVTGGTETLLVAEDDAAVLELAELALRVAGYTVLTASNGEEAIRVFEEHAEEIDMLIFDVVMPRLGGKEALEHILKKHPDLPHLFASGYSENAVHTNFIQNRDMHLLSKPYQTAALLRKIREVLDGK